MATVAVPTPACKTLIADLYGTDQAPSAPAPRPEPLPEAAFSLTLKGTIGGHEAMLTVRGRNPQEFQANVLAVRGMLDQALQPAQVPQTSGAYQAAKALGPVPDATPDGWCAVHSVQMGRQSNARGSWYSHKTTEGSWCKGR